MNNLGFDVMHVYGLTETYGHVTQCAWNEEWNELDEEKINTQLLKLAELSEKKGIAIGIGHVKPQTLSVLKREIPVLQKKGFRFEFVSRLVY